jgi:hypothetical protein
MFNSRIQGGRTSHSGSYVDYSSDILAPALGRNEDGESTTRMGVGFGMKNLYERGSGMWNLIPVRRPWLNAWNERRKMLKK